MGASQADQGWFGEVGQSVQYFEMLVPQTCKRSNKVLYMWGECKGCNIEKELRRWHLVGDV